MKKEFNTRNLKAFLNSDAIFNLIDEIYGCGWLDGGCYILAKALEIALPNSSIVMITDKGIPQHYLVEENNLYVDADGISTKSKLIKRWIKLEFLKNPKIEKLNRKSDEVPENESMSIILAMMIMENFNI